MTVCFWYLVKCDLCVHYSVTFYKVPNREKIQTGQIMKILIFAAEFYFIFLNRDKEEYIGWAIYIDKVSMAI